MHHIQKHILRTLMYTKRARFRDMRPPHVDSNVYSYHLRALQKEGLVEKTDRGYRLTPQGLFYVDKVSMENLEPRLQPKVITIIVAQNEDGEVLVFPKTKQPFINAFMLPFGKVHLEDSSIRAAAEREMLEKVKLLPDTLTHVGDCYIRARIRGMLVWNVVAHVFVTDLVRSSVTVATAQWVDPALITAKGFIPAAQHIVSRARSSSLFFFDELDVDW